VQALLEQVFEKVHDPATDTFYYYNKRTGASAWVKPTLLQDWGSDIKAIGE
jgi:hypothetical protein